MNFLFWTRPQREEINGEHPTPHRTRVHPHVISSQYQPSRNSGIRAGTGSDSSKRPNVSNRQFISLVCFGEYGHSLPCFYGLLRSFRGSTVVNNDPDYRDLYASDSVGHNGM